MATGNVYCGLNHHVYIGASKAAVKAAKDEYLKSAMVTSQVPIMHPVKSNPMGAIAPIAVATPFPP